MYQSARRRILAGALAIGAALALSACVNPEEVAGSGAGKIITVGSQGTAENDLVAQLYGQVLADNGYLVDYNNAIGGRETYLPALKSGVVDLVIDASGSVLYGTDPSAFARSPEDVVDALSAVLKPLEVHPLEAARAQDAEAFVVTAEFADEHHVTSIGDLAYIARSLTFGAGAGFESGRHGRIGLMTAYDVSGFALKTTDDGEAAAVSDLLTGAVQVAVISATTPAISRNDLVVLEDPKSLVTAENLVPLANKFAYTADVARLAETVSDALTTEQLRELYERGSSTEDASAERIARQWLAKSGLVD